ncbi:hypothetical protein [Georgenia alba]|uniref:Uncharacterized protein n=1 Tax=Georgenia alba TaxID=2233858 RepID=A0ABW2Q2U0_9MICO
MATGFASAPWRSPKQVAQLLAVVLALATSIAYLFVPAYEGVVSDGTTETTTTATLLEENGPHVLAVLAFPVLLTLLPLLVRGRAARWVGPVSVALLATFVVLGGFSIGLFYVPALLASVFGLALPTAHRRSTEQLETVPPGA